MKRSLIPLLLALACPAHAQVYMGTAAVIDGDTLDLGGERIRLHGIDAPESRQACQRNGETWACGQASAELLRELVQGQRIQCQQRDVDNYGRIVATCRVGNIDVAEAVAGAGLAVALPNFSQAYVHVAERARNISIGIWAGEFQMPADFRASNPDFERESVEWQRQRQARFARETITDRSPPARPRSNSTEGVFFRSCNAARAAGAGPFQRGQPGYRPQLDSDNDGIACEAVPRD